MKQPTNLPYALGYATAAASGYATAFITTCLMGKSDSYCAGEISAATLIAKEATFFGANLVLHSLFNHKNYSSKNDWLTDIKNISCSNLSSISISATVKASLHYVLMRESGFSPEQAMLWAYIPAGLLGTIGKIALDYKTGVIRNKQTLEETVK
jgi:hypothetical protein